MLVLKKRSIIIISVLLITVFTFIFCFGALNIKPIYNVSAEKLRVVLDAGHGGIDGGVIGSTTGVKESELNLSVVKKIEQYLISAGISVKLTRNSDAGLYGVATKNLKRRDMEKRKEIIEDFNPHATVSVHMNKFSVSSRRGAQVFYKSSDEYSKLLAQSVQNSFNEMESAPRECSILTGDYFILNCSKYASIIAECGFLSNPQDEMLLISEEYQEQIAYAIFKGIIDYFSISNIDFNA
ncbi:MAG: N-acetylmuramoyl-L-alanine amidase [Clostridia bacterium]|nr:N-acetylmuramoyl-L-alanine amidase [Clostridia bacterium]